MCGIVGVFSRAELVDPSALASATRALHHRGPDGSRQWISDDGRVGLGHARLSIIDLTTGDQPIASEDEQTRIVVNGEFYGYEAIQRELQDRGHRLRTRSDSEIALHLWEDYGVQCLHQLRGEFALPVRCPTMPCFGGSDGRTLYVTTARHQRPAQELQEMPHSGCVLAARVDVPGLPANFFID